MWNVDEIDPSYRYNEEGILLLKFTDPPPNAPTYHYNPPNDTSFGDQPLLGKGSSINDITTLGGRGIYDFATKVISSENLTMGGGGGPGGQ
jgi:hypothetical protein